MFGSIKRFFMSLRATVTSTHNLVQDLTIHTRNSPSSFEVLKIAHKASQINAQLESTLSQVLFRLESVEMELILARGGRLKPDPLNEDAKFEMMAQNAEVIGGNYG